jgi:hypothetical protein
MKGIIRGNFREQAVFMRRTTNTSTHFDFDDDIGTITGSSVFAATGSKSMMLDDNINNLAQIFTSQHVCTNCDSKTSTNWRRGPMGPKTLCDECGLKWSMGKMNLDENGSGGPRPGQQPIQDDSPYVTPTTSKSCGFDDFNWFGTTPAVHAEPDDDYDYFDVDVLGSSPDDVVDKMLSPRKFAVNRDNVLSASTPPSSLLSCSSTSILNSFARKQPPVISPLMDSQTLSAAVAAATASVNNVRNMYVDTPPIETGELVPQTPPVARSASAPRMTIARKVEQSSMPSSYTSVFMTSPTRSMLPPQSPSSMVTSPLPTTPTFSPQTPTRVLAHKRKATVTSVSPEGQHLNVQPLKITRSMHRTKKICSNCGVTKAPVWRKGPLGTSTLCNACGLKYALGTIVLDPATGAAVGRTGYLIFVDEGEEDEFLYSQSPTEIFPEQQEEEINYESPKKKKKKAHKKRRVCDEDDLIDEEHSHQEEPSSATSDKTGIAFEIMSSVDDTPVKRGRGRPRKIIVPDDPNKKDVGPSGRRGRPRKTADKKGNRKRRSSADQSPESDFIVELAMGNIEQPTLSFPSNNTTWVEESGDGNYTTRSHRHIKKPTRFDDFDEVYEDSDMRMMAEAFQDASTPPNTPITPLVADRNVIRVPMSMFNRKRKRENEHEPNLTINTTCLPEQVNLNSSPLGTVTGKMWVAHN